MIATASPLQPGGAATYKRLLAYVKPHRLRFAIAILGMGVYGAGTAGFAALMQPLLDGGFIDKDPQAIVLVPVAIVALFFFRGAGGFLSTYYMAQIGGLVVNRMRSQIFSKYLSLPASRYDQSSSGEMISLISFNVQNVANAASSALTVMVRDTLTALGLLGVMFYHSWQLAISLLVLGPIVTSIVYHVSVRFRRISGNIQLSMGEVSHLIKEALEGQREIKMYGGRHYEQTRFDRVNEKNRKLQLKMVATQAISVPITQFIIALFLAGIVYFCTLGAGFEHLSPGGFISFISAMMLLFAPLKQLTTVSAKLQQGIAACETVFSMLDEASEIDQGVTRIEVPLDPIAFTDITFRYGRDCNPALRGVSLAIHAGETVALVGHSGSGKTTLANLLARMYSIDGVTGNSGAITINGIDITTLSLESWRSQIAYVGQDVKLFNNSIAHNIAYGSLNAKSLEDIERASRAAHADDFIQQLPRGYDTQVGENGVLLSGGQRQRIAIARALLKNAPILILDEATSALDTESERKVQKGLETLLRGRTTLVVAHRLSTIERADNIVVMHDGKIIEMGRHRELLAKNSHYAMLHTMQFNDTDCGA